MLSEFTGVVPSTFLSKLFQNSVSAKSTYQLVEYKIEKNPIGRRSSALSVFMASIILSIVLAESVSQHGVYLNLR